MKYLYRNFEEYVKYAPFNKDHPMYEAYEIIWNMARIPYSEGEEDEE